MVLGCMLAQPLTGVPHSGVRALIRGPRLLQGFGRLIRGQDTVFVLGMFEVVFSYAVIVDGRFAIRGIEVEIVQAVLGNSASTARLRVGKVIVGTQRIRRVLGRSPVPTAVLCFHPTQLGQRVAIRITSSQVMPPTIHLVILLEPVRVVIGTVDLVTDDLLIVATSLVAVTAFLLATARLAVAIARVGCVLLRDVAASAAIWTTVVCMVVPTTRFVRCGLVARRPGLV